EAALAAAQADADRRLAAAQAEAEASLIRTIEAAKAEVALEAGRAAEDARASERAAERAATERIADGVRRLDASRSLTEIFDVLVDAASREAPRAAVFVVKGHTLTGWRAAGFTRDEDPRETELPRDQAGLLTAALRSGAAANTADAIAAEAGASPFGALPAASVGLAVPLLVGGDAVAVLYADDVSSRERHTPSAWPESVELLARHAARCLEVLTVSRVTQAVSIPAPSRPTPAPRRHTPQARVFQAGHDDDDDAARRYARLLVSEIKLYHESAVTAGRRDRNLRERLRTEIDRARRLYDERVPAPILARTDFFEQELVRTLANGDESLLGPV
ncbi:MAG TPA: GAF domain-containing protein, partial [Vicinamibacterales bacterium]|nr:GAF domain-containing protein [Vicinamibacterales bacterium]